MLPKVHPPPCLEPVSRSMAWVSPKYPLFLLHPQRAVAETKPDGWGAFLGFSFRLARYTAKWKESLVLRWSLKF